MCSADSLESEKSPWAYCALSESVSLASRTPPGKRGEAGMLAAPPLCTTPEQHPAEPLRLHARNRESTGITATYAGGLP